MPDVRGIFVSDLHLQARAPVARSAEPDWFEAMARPLEEIHDLKDRYQVPILYAGDIFDRWNAAPEVINFALKHLPHGYAIPGQHDLPHHRYEDIQRSAYWTLVKAGAIINVCPNDPIRLHDHKLVVHGFPWGFDPKPIEPDDGLLHIAIVHKFIWTKGTGYPGAPPGSIVSTARKSLAGFDAVAYGDNHKGFIVPPNAGGPTIINCGGMMRRKTDERDMRPGVGLLHAGGSVTRHYLDTTEDKFIERTGAEGTVDRVLDMTEFVAELHALGAGDALDFTAAMKRFLDDNDVPEGVRRVITDATG